MNRKLVCGVGINDAEYSVRERIGGTRLFCQFYLKWAGMLRRCYSGDKTFKTYSECYVCDEWLTFSNFKSWMENQDWEGKHLDKDLLAAGNKVYSPETCCFISPSLNIFVRSSGALQKYDGVSFHKKFKKFEAKVRNPLTGRRESLGYYQSEAEAIAVYSAKKSIIAKSLIENERNEAVKIAVLNLFGEYKHD